MCRCLFGCPVALHARKENVVSVLLSNENRALLKYYRYALGSDPDYLRFHSSSTALRLAAVLMLRDNSGLALEEKVEAPENCCLLEALEEAIGRMDGEERVPSEINQGQIQWRFS